MAAKEATLDLLERLPGPAQAIYEEVFSTAYDDYDGEEDELFREEAAHRVAWAAVRKEYDRTRNGKWHKKKR